MSHCPVCQVALRPEACEDPNHLESKNLAFYATNVVEGSGKVTGRVVKASSPLPRAWW